MKVESLSAGALGSVEIHLSVKEKNAGKAFYVIFKDPLPDNFKYDESPTSDTLDGIRQALKEFEEDCIRANFVRKVIFIFFKSSNMAAPVHKSIEGDLAKQLQGYLATNSRDLTIKDTCGLTLSYKIANEYTYKYKAVIGQKQEYNKQRGIPSLVSIYGWKEKLVYERIGGYPELAADINFQLNRQTMHDFNFHSGNHSHLIEHTDDAEQFLVNIIASMNNMIAKVTQFFNVEPEALVDQMKNQQLYLKAGS